MQAHHQQAEDRQHHGDQDEDDVVAERQPFPGAEIDHVGPEALAGHRGERARRDVALLDIDQERRDGAERHAHGGAEIMVGVVADRLGEDLRGQRLPAVGRAELERHAELAGAGHEHDDGARQDAGRDQRQRHRHRGAQQAGAGGARAVLERGVHAPQRADDEQIDQRRKEDAGHPDHAVDVVDVDQVAVDAEIVARPGVEQPDLGRGEIVPGDGADERAQEERDQVVGLEPVAPRAVGARVDPGERDAEERRQHGRAGADQERVDEGLRDDAVGEQRPVVVEPPGGVEPAGIEHLEARDDQREQRQQHRRRHDHADDERRDRLLRDQAAPAACRRRIGDRSACGADRLCAHRWSRWRMRAIAARVEARPPRASISRRPALLERGLPRIANFLGLLVRRDPVLQAEQLGLLQVEQIGRGFGRRLYSPS